MDGRVCLVLGLALLGGAAGCTPAALFSSRPKEVQAVKPPAPPAAPAEEEKETAKRPPKAESYVKFGDFRLRESMVAGKSEREQRKYRDEARQAYQQALDLNPKCLAAHQGLARVHRAENVIAPARFGP
jgi:hypothetical protein